MSLSAPSSSDLSDFLLPLGLSVKGDEGALLAQANLFLSSVKFCTDDDIQDILIKAQCYLAYQIDIGAFNVFAVIADERIIKKMVGAGSAKISKEFVFAKDNSSASRIERIPFLNDLIGSYLCANLQVDSTAYMGAYTV